jgi:hypothetical protein
VFPVVASTVCSPETGQVIIGGMLSFTAKFLVAVEVFPHASDAVKVPLYSDAITEGVI